MPLNIPPAPSPSEAAEYVQRIHDVADLAQPKSARKARSRSKKVRATRLGWFLSLSCLLLGIAGLTLSCIAAFAQVYPDSQVACVLCLADEFVGEVLQ